MLGIYEKLAHKMVQDTDGFLTDLTLYIDVDAEEYFVFLGDTDIYDPDPNYAELVTESLDEAVEFFDCYDDEEEYMW